MKEIVISERIMSFESDLFSEAGYSEWFIHKSSNLTQWFSMANSSLQEKKRSVNNLNFTYFILFDVAYENVIWNE